MKKLCKLSVLLVLMLAPLCGCVVTDTQKDTTNGNTENTEPEPLAYVLSDVQHDVGNYSTEGIYHYIVRSYSELEELYGGSVPAEVTAHDAAFFKDHSLIIVNMKLDYRKEVKFRNLEENSEGDYSLSFGIYHDSDNQSGLLYNYVQWVLEVNRVLEEDAEIDLVGIDCTDGLLSDE